MDIDGCIVIFRTDYRAEIHGEVAIVQVHGSGFDIQCPAEAVIGTVVKGDGSCGADFSEKAFLSRIRIISQCDLQIPEQDIARYSAADFKQTVTNRFIGIVVYFKAVSVECNIVSTGFEPKNKILARPDIGGLLQRHTVLCNGIQSFLNICVASDQGFPVIQML